jgi:lipoate-protein ligase A
MTPAPIRLLPFHVADGAWNMAADEALLEGAAAGAASLRFYGWSRPTLSLGYFQAAAVCRSHPGLGELPLVRRASGGAALVHHVEVTYALALPAGPPWQARGVSWLCRMHAILRDALADRGVQVRLCGDGEGRKLGEVLCFLHHTPGDLLVEGSKVAGSAQRKQRGALVQHGGILLAASPCTPQLPGIRELTGVAVDPGELCAAAVEQFARQTGWRLSAADWTAAEGRRIDVLAAAKYSRPWWNDKR